MNSFWKHQPVELHRRSFLLGASGLVMLILAGLLALTVLDVLIR